MAECWYPWLLGLPCVTYVVIVETSYRALSPLLAMCMLALLDWNSIDVEVFITVFAERDGQ